MSNLDDYIQSKWLKADDLDSSAVTFAIETIKEEEVGIDPETKLVVSFVGQRKRLILNQTNMKTLRRVFGKVSLEKLAGQHVTLLRREEDCFGEIKEVIRISATKPAAPKEEVPPLE
jgi:hypothetical protein